MINSQGLSRLRVTAIVDDDDIHSRLIDGWCSEFLNPLSGNRGNVLVPLPFPVPVLYQVTFLAGAVVRSKVELSSPIMMTLPVGTIVGIKGRAFSEHPVDHCLDRLQLSSIIEGWISVRLNQLPPQDLMIVKFVDIDPTFDPTIPHLFQQYQALHPIIEDTRDISSIDSTETVSVNMEQHNQQSSQSTSPISSSSQQQQQQQQPYAQCVICLTQDRNATIVHGETGHVACCLICARILKARGDKCPVCRLPIDLVIQQFWA